MQTKSSADRITTSLSLAHQRKHKQTNKQTTTTNLSTNHTIQSCTNHWTKLRKAETKRKKEFNLEGWEKETSNTMLKNSKNEKAEKYHINEGTN